MTDILSLDQLALGSAFGGKIVDAGMIPSIMVSLPLVDPTPDDTCMVVCNLRQLARAVRGLLGEEEASVLLPRKMMLAAFPKVSGF
jgi:hypothetical protein